MVGWICPNGSTVYESQESRKWFDSESTSGHLDGAAGQPLTFITKFTF